MVSRESFSWDKPRLDDGRPCQEVADLLEQTELMAVGCCWNGYHPKFLLGHHQPWTA